MAEIRIVGIIGGGLMGAGIAELVARAGYQTIIREVNDDLARAGLRRIESSLDRALQRERVTTRERDQALGLIRTTTELEELSSADIIIEAITEDIDAKNETFRALDAIAPPHTIFASNTSSLTITDMAAATERPDRIVGLHFFNPVPVMQLVEVVRTIATDQMVYDQVLEFAHSLGKVPVEARDTSGFIVNRLLVPYVLDAIRALESGLGSTTDIDRAMVLGTGHPMGPFTLSDLVGNDTLLQIAEILFNEFREQRFAPPPLLRRLVAMGYNGRKSGKGFYDYSGDEPVPMELGA